MPRVTRSQTKRARVTAPTPPTPTTTRVGKKTRNARLNKKKLILAITLEHERHRLDLSAPASERLSTSPRQRTILNINFPNERHRLDLSAPPEERVSSFPRPQRVVLSMNTPTERLRLDLSREAGERLDVLWDREREGRMEILDEDEDEEGKMPLKREPGLDINLDDVADDEEVYRAPNLDLELFRAPTPDLDSEGGVEIKIEPGLDSDYDQDVIMALDCSPSKSPESVVPDLVPLPEPTPASSTPVLLPTPATTPPSSTGQPPSIPEEDTSPVQAQTRKSPAPLPRNRYWWQDHDKLLRSMELARLNLKTSNPGCAGGAAKFNFMLPTPPTPPTSPTSSGLMPVRVNSERNEGPIIIAEGAQAETLRGIAQAGLDLLDEMQGEGGRTYTARSLDDDPLRRAMLRRRIQAGLTVEKLLKQTKDSGGKF